MAALAPLAPNAHRYGPFVALDRGDHGHGAVVRAFDPVLRRQVWIEVKHASAPPISSARRDLARRVVLHWLTGRRSADESWDAYEAPDGGAGRTRLRHARGGRRISSYSIWWTSSRARRRTDTQPPLALDRIWLRDNGRVVLLDFAPPGAPPEAGRTSHRSNCCTPRQAAFRGSLRTGLLPLSAHGFSNRWSWTLNSPACRRARHAHVNGGAPNYVHWWRRGIPGTLAAAAVVLMLVVTSVLVPALGRFQSSETMGMMNLLGVLQSTPRGKQSDAAARGA
jgi:hypothetical protein